jgi:hypothetical protein
MSDLSSAAKLFCGAHIMTSGHRLQCGVIPLLLIAFAVPAIAGDGQNNGAWDGTWTGLLNNRAPIAIAIQGDKVVSYAIEGAPFDIRYSKVTPTSVSFGDRDHYAVKLTKTSETTAAEIAHGRLGFGKATLTKQ